MFRLLSQIDSLKWPEPEVKSKILVTSLDGAGKTTLMHSLQLDQVETTIPKIDLFSTSSEYPWHSNLTLSFRLGSRMVKHGGTKFICWDIGGCTPRSAYLPTHGLAFPNAKAIVAIVDATDYDRIVEAEEELRRRIWDEGIEVRKELRGSPSWQQWSDATGFDIVAHEPMLNSLPVLVLANKSDMPVR